MAYDFNALLGRLVGHRMHSVQFALDYVQLWFEPSTPEREPVLSCDVLPAVILGDHRLAADDPGWSNALRSLIGQDVTATHEAPGNGIQIDLAAGSITLRPTEDELVGPEIARLSGFEDGGSMIWRPGEEAYEHL